MKIFCNLILGCLFILCNSNAQQLAKPSSIQYKWHEQELICFSTLPQLPGLKWSKTTIPYR